MWILNFLIHYHTFVSISSTELSFIAEVRHCYKRRKRKTLVNIFKKKKKKGVENFEPFEWIHDDFSKEELMKQNWDGHVWCE